MATKSNRKIGDEAEEIASTFLLNKGWEILARNYYAGHYEIDIIAKDGPIYVFLEVKMRSSTQFGSPVEFVSEAKVERIFAAAEQWMQQNQLDDFPVRFDVIGILKTKSKQEITHLEDAFR